MKWIIEDATSPEGSSSNKNQKPDLVLITAWQKDYSLQDIMSEIYKNPGVSVQFNLLRTA